MPKELIPSGSSAAAAEPVVMKLSDLRTGVCLAGLPALCRQVRAVEVGRCVCAEVDDLVESLSQACGTAPFVLCCRWTPKSLVVPTQDGQVYVAFCRSPIPDYRHLKELACLLGPESAGDVKRDLWDPLPVFGEDFVDQVAAKMQEDPHIRIAEATLEGLNRLGRAYTPHFALDVAAYSGLAAIPTDDCSSRGALRIGVLSRGKEGAIARFIVKRIGPKSGVGLADDSAIPVVGLVVDCEHLAGLEDCLNSKLIQKFDSVLVGPSYQHTPKTFPEKGRNPERDSEWNASLCFHLDPMPDDEWLERAAWPVKVALHVGSGTATHFLMGRLKTGGQNGFREWLGRFANPAILPETGRGRPLLFCGVLGDFANTLDTLAPKEAKRILKTRSETINDIFAFAERQPFLYPCPQMRDERERQRRLIDHLSNGHPRYIHMIRMDMLKRELRESGYNETEIVDLFVPHLVAHTGEYSGRIVEIEGDDVTIEFDVDGDDERRRFAVEELRIDRASLRVGQPVVAMTSLAFLPSTDDEPTPEQREAARRRLKELEAEWKKVDRSQMPHVPPLDL